MTTTTVVNFLSEVKISRYSTDTHSSQTDVNFNPQVGGALGLWLGLGVLQLLQEVFGRICSFYSKF